MQQLDYIILYENKLLYYIYDIIIIIHNYILSGNNIEHVL